MATISKSVTVVDGGTYTLELNAIPTGSTVTPVNDIQIWLHCADIWNKNYTTLDQVLADAPTLQALIASNNAADYMARSTDWASDSNIGLVPVMTSNTTPSGTVSYHTASSGYEGFRAFNGGIDTAISSSNKGYTAAYNDTDAYLRYAFQNSVKAKKAYLRWNLTAGATAKFQGLNSNNTWEDISSTITMSASATTLEVDINSNNKYYQQYQLKLISGDWYQGEGFKLQFYQDSGIPNNQNAMTYIGANDYCTNKLLSDTTWLNAICNSAYSESVLNVKVPTMTSNTAPYGEASASSASSGYEAYKAFDNNPSTAAQAPSRVATAYLQYKFINSTNVRAFDWGATSNPAQDFSLQVSYSDDGTNFTNAGEAQIYASSVNGQVARFKVADYGRHLYWRVTRTCITDARSGIAFTLQFYGRT